MTDSIEISDSAAARMAVILAKEQPGCKFRIAVLGGGCSGFQYNFEFDAKNPSEQDLVIEKNGVSVVIDDISLGLISGSVLDYFESLGSSGFEVKNPNATAKCGCGNSFAL